MRSAGNFNSEWGYIAPAPSFMRTVRVVLVATAIGATAGAAVVLSLIDRPTADRTASITARAIVTSAQAAPATAVAASSTTAALAAPVSVTTAAPATIAATAQTQSSAPVMPQVKPPAAPPSATPQVAMQPPPVVAPPTVAAPQAAPTVTPQVAIQPQRSDAASQASVANDSSASENSAASGGSVAPAPRPASGFASLSDVRPATEAAPAETTDRALIPPQPVPAKKPKLHAAYASNSKYKPTPGIGTALRRLFSPHSGTYPNR
jgi:hypothetical protein